MYDNESPGASSDHDVTCFTSYLPVENASKLLSNVDKNYRIILQRFSNIVIHYNCRSSIITNCIMACWLIDKKTQLSMQLATSHLSQFQEKMTKWK